MVTVVSFQPSTREFSAVEAAPAGTAEPELSVEALRLRVRQQELLSEFGVLALLFQAIPWVSYDSSTDTSKVDILGSSKLNTLGPFLLQLEIPHSKFSQSQETVGSRMLTE